MQYDVGDLVRCIWGAKPVEYEARILDVDKESEQYYVHYQGWNKRYDEWITEKFIIGLSKKQVQAHPSTETPKIRHSKREKKIKKPVDWSPAHNATTRGEEKPMRKKTSYLSSKSKHPPVNKSAKRPAPSASPVVDDSTDDGLTSDEEIIDLSIPRSYIDVLAKAKKRAERKQEQGKAPQQAGHGRHWNFPQAKSVPNGAQAVTRPVSINKHITAVSTSSTVSSTCMECHNFASIGGDYNYSILRFHYNKARPVSTERKDPSASEVTSSTKRVLPVRKPLSFQFALPHRKLTYKFEKSSPANLSRRQRDPPPNLGTPYNYNDEYHSRLISSSMDYESSFIPTASRLLHEEESDSRTFSSSSSELDDISAALVPITTSEAVSTVTIVT